MGCDIHAYIEYSYFNDSNNDSYWSCFAAGFGSRDYRMFGHLAGVRGSAAPVVSLRGLPTGNSSYEVQSCMFMNVTDDDKLVENGAGWCSARDAKTWGITKTDNDGNPVQARNPDIHSIGWLDRAELAQVLAAYMFDGGDYPYNVEWDAALAAMAAFEERGIVTRLVFGFDN